MDVLVSSVDALVIAFSRLFPEGFIYFYVFNVYALFGIVLVALVCGSMGPLVVGNRMAFFSDALAHCAFAGFALGMIIFLAVGFIGFREQIVLIMVAFGVVVGLLIAFVRERTGLASDTVIGVFFAGAIGLGAVFVPVAAAQQFIDIESFIFGDPQYVEGSQLLYLFVLLVITAAFLYFTYNDMVLASVSPSLALSRNVPVRRYRYIFIVLLALIVNLCLQVVGILLINAMLIVPAAAAATVSRNLRQLFWLSLAFSLGSGIGGQWLAWSLRGYEVGTGGTIVVLNVLLFALAMLFASRSKSRAALAP